MNEEGSWQDKQNEICYVGGIADIRGGLEIVKSLEQLDDVKLNFAGNFSGVEFETKLKATDGWKQVKEHGFLDRIEQVKEIMARSFAGLVTFHALPNHVDAQPNKMFEYECRTACDLL